MKPSLPQYDPNAASRQAELAATRAHFPWDHDFLAPLQLSASPAGAAWRLSWQPVATVLSGPPASVVGACARSGAGNAIIATRRYPATI